MAFSSEIKWTYSLRKSLVRMKWTLYSALREDNPLDRFKWTYAPFLINVHLNRFVHLIRTILRAFLVPNDPLVLWT